MSATERMRREPVAIAATPFAALCAVVRAGRTWCRQKAERRRQRRALAQLDDRLLRDIGVSREQAARESARPFWR